MNTGFVPFCASWSSWRVRGSLITIHWRLQTCWSLRWSQTWPLTNWSAGTTSSSKATWRLNRSERGHFPTAKNVNVWLSVHRLENCVQGGHVATGKRKSSVGNIGSSFSTTGQTIRSVPQPKNSVFDETNLTVNAEFPDVCPCRNIYKFTTEAVPEWPSSCLRWDPSDEQHKVC